MGADLHKKGREGATPLQLDKCADLLHLTRLHGKSGADVDEYDAQIGTLLHVAVKALNEESKAMLTDATESLIAVVRDGLSTEADMNAAAQSFFAAARISSRDEANVALQNLSGSFHLDDPSRAAFLALLCGALIERGCDPTTIAQPLTERLTSLLESSAALVNACVAKIQESSDEGEDPIDAFEGIREQIAPSMPRDADAWKALERFWAPAIAVYSMNSEARASARHLRDLASQIADYHVAGHWLGLILAVLDHEPIVVIEPETAVGILRTVSGIVDNFQLNV